MSDYHSSGIAGFKYPQMVSVLAGGESVSIQEHINVHGGCSTKSLHMSGEAAANLAYALLKGALGVDREKALEVMAKLSFEHHAETAEAPAAHQFPAPDCKTCGGTGVDPGGLSVCRDCHPSASEGRA